MRSARDLLAHPTFRSSPFRTLGRALAWGLHCLSGRPAIVQPVGGYPGRLFVPPLFQGSGGTSVFVLREYGEHDELEWVRRSLAEGMVFVDGGANIGVYTVLAGKLVGAGGAVYSFEPARGSFSALERNIELNGLTNVQAFRAALSDTNGRASLYHIGNKPNVFSLGRSTAGEGSEEVEMLALDDALAGARPDFVKLDVEGAEELVLRGAERALRGGRPVVMFEYSDRPRRLGLEPDGAWRLLERHGYRLHGIEPGGVLAPRDTVRVGNNVGVYAA